MGNALETQVYALEVIVDASVTLKDKALKIKNTLLRIGTETMDKTLATPKDNAL